MRLYKLLYENDQKQSLQQQLAKLQREYQQLPKNPTSQQGYDALEEYQDKIEALKKKIKQQSGGTSSAGGSSKRQAVEKKLNDAKRELKAMPKHPSTQQHYDMIDDLHAKISKYKKELSSLKENDQSIGNNLENPVDDSANSKYSSVVDEINQKIDEINCALENHNQQQQSDNDNWGLVEDAEKILDHLKQASEILAPWCDK